VADGKEPVSFDDFSKIDIRTATILEAEKVPKTTKLLKLKIDTGLDVRTIVSGIAEYYNPEDIIGKQISVVANLEPRKIKGIESKGMILMAEDKDGRLVMVSAVDPVNNGSTIK
jgi:methionyl-tRNA synthetase